MSNVSTLPAHEPWVITRLGAITDKLVDGSHNPPPKVESGRPMLSARNVEWGRVEFSDYREIADDAFRRERVRTDARPGDVLLTIVGTIGRAAVVTDAMPEFTLQRSVALLRLRGVDPKFCMYQLLAEPAQDWLRKSARGSAQQGVYLKTLRELPLVIPPLDQQREIVAEIEKQFTRLEAGVAGLRRVQANLKRYRAAVLKAACEGKLVPTEAELARQEGRNFESGSQFLDRILTERRQKWSGKGKYKEPAKPNTAHLLELPEGWISATWEQIAFSQNGRPFPSAQYVAKGCKLLRPGNLHVSGNVEWTEDNTRRMPQRFADENPDLIVRGREIVMNLTAQSLKDEFLGRVCLTSEGEECLLNQRLARLTPIVVTPEFALYLLKAWRFRRFVDGLNSGSLIQHMFTSQLAEFTFPLPPHAEQLRIVAEVERRLSVVEELETVVNANLQRSTRLRQSILQKAFTGQLG